MNIGEATDYVLQATGAMLTIVCWAGGAAAIGATNEVETAEKFAQEAQVNLITAPAPRWEAAVIASSQSGEAWYEIGGRIGGERWSSRLLFPLDGTQLGLRAGHTWRKRNGTPDFSMELTALRNVEHPDRPMTDTDKYPGSVIIGYTESRVKLQAWSLDVRISKHLQHSAPVPSLCWALIAGCQWQDLSYRAMGLRGFYREPLPEEEVFLHDDELVLTYRLDCATVYAGVAGRWRMAAPLAFAGELAAGVARVEDDDHHVLREKVCRGTADGLSVRARLAVSYEPEWSRKHALGWFLEAEAEFSAVRASGTQEQWLSEEDLPARLTVPEDLQITQRQIGLGIGCRF